MARTVTPTERARLQAANVGEWWKVEIADGLGGWRDFTSVNSADYTLAASVQSSGDTVSSTASVVLRSGKGAASIAAAMNGATVNATARALDVGRAMRVWCATIAPTATPVTADWKCLFDGVVSRYGTQENGEAIALAGEDRMRPITRATFPLATWFGDGTIALETVIQSILTTTMGGAAPTLVTPVSPAWAPARIDVTRGTTAWEAISALVDNIGWLVRWRWNGNTPELRLYGPNRTPTVADFTFLTSETRSFSAFDLDLESVRNHVEVGVRVAGALSVATATDAPSITAYGLQKLIVREDASSQVNTMAEAQRMADAIRDDTRLPPVSHSMQHPHVFWPAEPGDVIDVPPNGVTHDATIRLAVWSVLHTFEGVGEGNTTLLLRGAPASRGRGWLDFGTPNGSASPGRIEWLGATQSGANIVQRFRAYAGTGAQLTDPAQVSALVSRTPAGAASTSSAVTVLYSAGDAWFYTAPITRAYNDVYRLDVSVLPRGDTLAGAGSVTLPVFTILSTGGAPRFATCTIDIATPTSGTAGADVEVRFTTSDAPAGAVYSAVVSLGYRIDYLSGIATGEVITLGRPIASGSGGPYVNAYVITGSVKMHDAAGLVLAEILIPSTNYYGP